MTKIIEPPLTDEIAEKNSNAPSRSKSTSLRKSMEAVFEKLGGEEGFKTWIEESTANKRIFYRDILPKLVPKEANVALTGQGGGPIRYSFVWEGGPEDPAKATEKVVDVTKPIAIVAESIDLDDNSD